MRLVTDRPLRIWERTARDAALAPRAVVDSGGAPCAGRERVSILARMPVGGGTVRVAQRSRRSDAWIDTDTFTARGPGVVRAHVPLAGEHVKVTFRNGRRAQGPEILITLV